MVPTWIDISRFRCIMTTQWLHQGSHLVIFPKPLEVLTVFFNLHFFQRNSFCFRARFCSCPEGKLQTIGEVLVHEDSAVHRFLGEHSGDPAVASAVESRGQTDPLSDAEFVLTTCHRRSKVGKFAQGYFHLLPSCP